MKMSKHLAKELTRDRPAYFSDAWPWGQGIFWRTEWRGRGSRPRRPAEQKKSLGGAAWKG